MYGEMHYQIKIRKMPTQSISFQIKHPPHGSLSGVRCDRDGGALHSSVLILRTKLDVTLQTNIIIRL